MDGSSPSPTPSQATVASPASFPPMPTDYEGWTIDRFANSARSVLGFMRDEITKTCRIVEPALQQDEALMRRSLRTLTKLTHDSQILSLQLMAIAAAESRNPGNVQEAIIRFHHLLIRIGSMVIYWEQTPQYPNDLLWVEGSDTEQREAIQQLSAFENKIEGIQGWIIRFVLAFSVAPVKELKGESLNHSTQNPAVENPNPTEELGDIQSKPQVDEEIRRHSELANHSWKRYKDAAGAHIRRHEFHRSSRHPSTGTWLINNPEFASWLHDQSQYVLWCRGEPGSSKSFLTSRVIDSLQRNGYHHAYFYMGPGKVQSASGVILALLEQLCVQTGTFPPSLKRGNQPTEQGIADETIQSQTHNSTTLEDGGIQNGSLIQAEALRNEINPAMEPLLAALRSICSSQPFRPFQLFIVLDGWDEDNMDVAEEFQEIIEVLCLCSCKLYISSRPNQAFKAASVKTIEDRKAQHLLDISTYIRDQLRGGLNSNLDRIDDAAAEIFYASSINFNVASIMTQTVLRVVDTRGYIEKLKNINISDRLSKEIVELLLNPQNLLADINHVSRVIVYLLEATGPLSIGALKASLPAILKHQYPSDPDHDFEAEKIENVVKNCEPFVTIDRGNQLVRLNMAINNRSDILESWPGEAPKVYLAIVKSSLELISQLNPPTGATEAESELVDLLRDHPELEHAATWPNYVQRLVQLGGAEYDSAKEAAAKFLENEEDLLFAFQVFLYAKEEHRHHGTTWDVLNLKTKTMSKPEIMSQWGFAWAT
ncbi:hypothetical protein F5Y10DRAFT_254626 [Nemania abortiva]|nr:hypothetical protein F5Y10DRAFT_254626 [Nemania abortiva]